MKSYTEPDPYIDDFSDLLSLLRKADADNDEQTQLKIIRLINKDLPTWFIPMLNDTKRNNFYEKMIKKHVKGKTILEIGAGVGLWGLMAAKYGAKHVYACELNPLMYCLAKENIEKGPYAKKITLFFAHSDSLELGNHIPKKVDIILSELISSDIFSENMVPTLDNAKKLLKKNGLYLPSEITAHGCLIELQEDLPTRIQSSSNTAFQLLGKLTANQSTYINLNLFPFKITSVPVKLFSLVDGFKISPELPLELNLQKNIKLKTKSTYFCVYFSINDGAHKLMNLDIKNKKNNCHWENIVWKLDNKKASFNLKLINQDERLCLIGQ